MAKSFDPTFGAVSMASRVEEARVALRLLADKVDVIKHQYPKGASFIEDMAHRLALGNDVVVTERQLEFLRGLCERNTGSLPEDHMKKRKRSVAWKK